MRFEEFFVKMYDIGMDLAYEILKHIGPLFRHQWNYDAAYRFLRCKWHFISFSWYFYCYYSMSFIVLINIFLLFCIVWIELHNRLALVLITIRSPLQAFEWKLEKCQINFSGFFWQFITHFVYDLPEFQAAFRACLRIVSVFTDCGIIYIEISSYKMNQLWQVLVLSISHRIRRTKVPYINFMVQVILLHW